MTQNSHQEKSIFQTKAFRQGLSFGVVSSAMTVLGISLGVWSSAGKLRAIVASIIGLSISNSLADAFSIYMSDTATGDSKNALISAAVTAGIEFILPFLFLLPFLTMKLKSAVILNSIIGIALVAGTGLYVAKLNKHSDKRTLEDIMLYVGITVAIMALTYVGGLIVNKLV
jgi:VIT1/CCC1 family predicted Fe2+/Mn2+ transporter